MLILKRINLGLLIIVGIAAGLAKVLLLPDEKAFLANLGFNDWSIVLFGIIQSTAGASLTIPRTRFVGAVVLALTFTLSTLTIFVSGNTAFGFFSVVPILMTLAVLKQSLLPKQEAAANE